MGLGIEDEFLVAVFCGALEDSLYEPLSDSLLSISFQDSKTLKFERGRSKWEGAGRSTGEDAVIDNEVGTAFFAFDLLREGDALLLNKNFLTNGETVAIERRGQIGWIINPHKIFLSRGAWRSFLFIDFFLL